MILSSRLLQAVVSRFHLERFFYGEGPEVVPITLNRQRIFILPTREGVLFGCVMGTMLIGATNYDNSMGYLLTFLLAGFGLVSMLHTYRNMAQLTFRAGHCLPVFAGDRAQYTLYLDNTSPVQRFALTLVLDDGEPARIDVPAQDTARVVVTRPSQSRGYLPMGRCTVSTSFPVGLFRAWAYVDLDMRCLVYPLPTPHTPLPPMRLSDRERGGTQGLGAEDFTGLRQYVPGDSPRHIAWKHTAHGGELLTKQFAGEGTMQRWLAWDAVPYGDIETRLAVLCRWVISAHAAGLPYGLRLPGVELAPAHTPMHRDACLKALALFGKE